MRLKYAIIVGIVLLIAIIYFHFGGSSGPMSTISGGGKYLLPLLIASALVDSTNPCAFSILLLTVAFLFGIGRMRSDILRAGGLYILGIFLVYTFIGLGILQALELFNVPHFMAKVGALILIAFGLLNLISHFSPSFPVKLGIPQSAHGRTGELMARASLPTSFGLGIVVGLFEFPCAGGPYLSVLGLLHDQGYFWLGLDYLLLFNLIFVLPLIVMLLIASNKQLLDKAQAWRKSETVRIKLWSGLAMVTIGLIVMSL